jgi:hypothetical protein
VRVLVFGSCSLTAKHLPAVRDYLRDIAETLGEGEKLVLVHEDRPPGKAKGAIGAARLSEVAAMDAWPKEARGLYRTEDVLRYRLDRALCFHTSPDLGHESAAMADRLKAAGYSFRLLVLSEAGEVVSDEVRAP